MKKISYFIILSCITTLPYAQLSFRDSLRALLSKAKNDTIRVDLLSRISRSYNNASPDSQFLYAQQGLKIAQSIGYIKGEMDCKQNLALYWWTTGDYATSLKLLYTLLEYHKSRNDTLSTLITYGFLLNNYRDQGDHKEALRTSFLIIEMTQKYHNCNFCQIAYAVTGSVYYEMSRFDSALYYLNKALDYQPTFGYSWVLLMNGRIQEKIKNSNLAFRYYKKSVKALQAENNLKDLAGAYISIAQLYQETGHADSAVYYGKQALNLAQQGRFLKEVLQSYLVLSGIYEKTNTNVALDYYKLAMTAKDSLYNQEKQRQILSYKFNEELQQQEVENAQQQSKNRNRIYGLLGVLAASLLIVIFLVRNNRHKQKINALLQQQKHEIERTLSDLKATQSQLVQREKMASLGELTAGIAHEIQNPLNFVNNFSEVNTELLAEMKEEIGKGNIEEVKAIADDLEENLEKINHHGKRADAIVKGMLQHSRASTGKKEPTDINALADEYLRLSYHGLRAKDKDFNVDFKTDFDESIGKIEVVPQDIGRVLLNLYNNAFYAASLPSKGGVNEAHQPTVWVTTELSSSLSFGEGRGEVIISVKDNGPGIPQKIVDKIFQPFFTTKPTGQGTGLGLSLSYDIIKAHGGELKVESKEGEGATFIIQLPIQSHQL